MDTEMMKTFFAIRALCALVLLVGVCVCSFGCELIVNCVTAPMIIAGNNSGWFELSGEVVDEEGKPIHGVTLQVTRHKMGTVSQAFKGGRPRGHTTEQIANGSFDIKVFGASGVTIYFLKEGYYSENLYLNKRDNTIRIQEYMQPDGRARVVLQKKGVMTHLKSKGFNLKFNLDGSGIVANVSTIFPDERGVYWGPDTVSVENVREATVPGIVMYVTVDIDENGRFATKGYPENYPNRGLQGDEPVRMRLRINGENNGFIKVTELSEKKPLGRVLLLAPETGYENEVVFAPEDTGVFYCCIGGKYGRGRIGWSYRVSDDTKSMETTVTLYMQFDGSRNLETGVNW